MKFVLLGRCPSKKNSREQITVRGRRINVPNWNYQKWEKMAVGEIARQAYRQPPLSGELLGVEFVFWMADNRKKDLSNAAEGCLDAMVKAGVVPDDCWQEIPHVFLHCEGIDKENPRVEITMVCKGDRPTMGRSVGKKG